MMSDFNSLIDCVVVQLSMILDMLSTIGFKFESPPGIGLFYGTIGYKIKRHLRNPTLCTLHRVTKHYFPCCMID